MEPILKLYLLEGTALGYDTYSEIIVTAYSEEEAKLINPYGNIYPKGCPVFGWGSTSWTHSNDPSKIKSQYIGEASPNLKPNTVILTSFNAG